jgi:hypothetical protein
MTEILGVLSENNCTPVKTQGTLRAEICEYRHIPGYPHLQRPPANARTGYYSFRSSKGPMNFL